MWCVSRTMDRVLRQDIRIDSQSSKDDKMSQMIEGIQNVLAQGRNVVMFIDAHKSKTPMRTLNRRVLELFPNVPKQLVHLIEPASGVGKLHFRRFPATKTLDKIVTCRERILSSNRVHGRGNV